MKLSLLATKTFLPPIPEYLVARPRLERRLDAALLNHHRLILVSALPGSGKSSLLAAWAAHRAAPLAWISLETSDNDPVRFWSYFLASIQGRFPDTAQDLLEDLNSAPSIPPTFLPELVNLLCSQPEPLVVVLDDYHCIQDPEIQAGVQYVLDHMPAQACLAITTRIDPPLPVHRWRARGQLTEIRAADLRFTTEEAAEFLTHQMGLDLQPEDIRKLEQRTEGWATGLQLAALSMQGRPEPQGFIDQFSGSHHFVLEYLMNEVLSRQDEAMQRFLVYTSILESFCASLCDAVLEASLPPAQDTLASLERANLFLIPLDEEHAWFRYHALFASFLQQRLKRLGSETLRRLHQRAAEWYAEAGRVDEALGHAIAAENYAFAVQIIEKHAMPAASDGRARAVVHWIELLPEKELSENVQLILLYAWMLLAIGRTNSLEPHLNYAQRLLTSKQGDIPNMGERRTVLAQLAALRAMQAARAGDQAATERLVEEARRSSAPDSYVHGLAWLVQANLQRELGDFEQSITAYARAMPLLPLTGILSGTLSMVQAFAQAYLVQGQVQTAESLYRSSLAQAIEIGQRRVPALGILQIGLAGIAYEKNRMEEARSLFEVGAINSRRSGMVDLLSATALLEAQLSRLDGAVPQAIQHLKEELQGIHRGDSPNRSAEIRAWLARLQAEAGDLAEAAAWARTIQAKPEANPGYTHGVELFNLVRVLYLQGRLEEALELAASLERLAINGRSLGRMVEAEMLQAEILWKLGRQTESTAKLGRSLELAEPAGYARLFLDEGSRLAPALAAWQASGEARPGGYGRWLLDCFRREAGAAAAPGQASAATPEMPDLTGRELDVLGLLAEGLSYPEIAERLVVSAGTVKTHASHIYAKLGVQGRQQAVRRAQELKII